MPARRLYPLIWILPILLITVVVTAVRPARAQAPRRVGIVVATEVNIAREEADALAVELAEALREALSVDVIAGDETRRRLPPRGLPEGCLAETGCRQDLGRRLDVAELLLLVIVRIGDRVQIDPTWANVASGEVITRDAVVLAPEAATAADRAAVWTEAAPRLLPHLVPQREPSAAPGEPHVIVVPAAARAGGEAGRGRRMTRGAWISAGVGAAALMGGAVFGLSAQRKFQSFEDAGCRTTPSCTQDDVDALARHALVADALLAVSLAAGATSLVLYLRSAGDDAAAPPADAPPADAPPADAPPALAVGAGPGMLSVSLGGTF